MSAVAENKGPHPLLDEDHPRTRSWPDAGIATALRLPKPARLRARDHGRRSLAGRFYCLQDQYYEALEALDEAARAFAGVCDTIAMLAAQLDDGELRTTFSQRMMAETHSARQMPRSKGAGQALQELTQREREVAVLVATGKTNRMIAAELHIGVRTVETHVGSILSKLDFSSRSQIVAWALEHDLHDHQR